MGADYDWTSAMPAEEREYQDAAETSANSVKVLDTALSFIETLMERPQRHAGWRTAFQRLKDSDEAAAAAASDDEDEADGEDADAAGGVAADVVAGSPASSSAAAKGAGGGGGGGDSGGDSGGSGGGGGGGGKPPKLSIPSPGIGGCSNRQLHSAGSTGGGSSSSRVGGGSGSGSSSRAAAGGVRLPMSAPAGRKLGRSRTWTGRQLQAVANQARREFAEELANELQRAQASLAAAPAARGGLSVSWGAIVREAMPDGEGTSGASTSAANGDDAYGSAADADASFSGSAQPPKAGRPPKPLVKARTASHAEMMRMMGSTAEESAAEADEEGKRATKEEKERQQEEEERPPQQAKEDSEPSEASR